ncbi:MAG: ATP-binding cassette domain-containing protein, partial [Sphingobium sp.]
DMIFIDQQRSLMAPEKRVREVLAEAKVGTVSGGERSRLLLARDFARESNLLVLDEPTNDLDLETMDLLQEVIADYDGTVLIVSHDRDFLDKTVTMTLGLDGSGEIDIVVGGYQDWIKQRKARNAPKLTRKVETAAPVAPAPKVVKLTYKDQRDYELLPRRIEEIEAAIARDEATLADPALYVKNPDKFASLTKAIDLARAEKDAAEERWLELAEKVGG